MLHPTHAPGRLEQVREQISHSRIAGRSSRSPGSSTSGPRSTPAPTRSTGCAAAPPGCRSRSSPSTSRRTSSDAAPRGEQMQSHSDHPFVAILLLAGDESSAQDVREVGPPIVAVVPRTVCRARVSTARLESNPLLRFVLPAGALTCARPPRARGASSSSQPSRPNHWAVVLARGPATDARSDAGSDLGITGLAAMAAECAPAVIERCSAVLREAPLLSAVRECLWAGCVGDPRARGGLSLEPPIRDGRDPDLL